MLSLSFALLTAMGLVLGDQLKLGTLKAYASCPVQPLLKLTS